MAQTTTGNPQSAITIMQINAGRGFITTAEVRNCADKSRIDVVAIQEPYNLRGNIANFGGRARTITGGKPGDNAWAAIIVFNPNLTIMKLDHLSDEHLVCAQIDNGLTDLYIVSGYFQFSDPIELYITKTSNIIRALKGKKIILCLDANSKSPMWHSDTLDENGEKMEDFIQDMELMALNEPGNPSTFATTRGKSNIDITLS